MSHTENIQKLEHVGMIVPNLQKAIDFYSKALGIKEFHVFESHRKPGTYEKSGPPTITHVAIGQSASLTFELMEVVSGQNLFKDLLDTRGEGTHLAFIVADLDQEIARARQQGLRVIYHGVGKLSDGGSSALLGAEEPGGMLIQFLQTKNSLLQRVSIESKEIPHA